MALRHRWGGHFAAAEALLKGIRDEKLLVQRGMRACTNSSVGFVNRLFSAGLLRVQRPHIPRTSPDAPSRRVARNEVLNRAYLFFFVL